MSIEHSYAVIKLLKEGALNEETRGVRGQIVNAVAGITHLILDCDPMVAQFGKKLQTKLFL